MSQVQLTLDYVKSLMKETYFLSNDYTEVFKNYNYLEEHNNKKLINMISDCVDSKSLELLIQYHDELILNDFNESINLSDEFVCLKDEVMNSLNSTEFMNVPEFFEDNRDKIEDLIWERNFIYDGNSLSNMLNSIGHLNVYVPLGITINEFWQVNDEDEEFKEIYDKVSNMFNIEYDEDEDNKFLLFNMLSQGNSGELVVWFTFDLSNFITIENDEFKFKDIKYIKFENNVTLGVVDFVNGGGDSCDFKMTKPTYIKFDDNFKISFDYITGYNYVHSVCGMSRDWCVTEYEVIDSKPTTDDFNNIELNVETNEFESLKQKERKYELSFNQGNCTLGDTNMNRHKNREYFNEPPYCRWQCSECGQTWLD